MAEVDLQEVENATKQLLDGRMDSVRDLARARAHIATKQDELRQAESADKAAYDAALKAGWTADELRKVGLGQTSARGRSVARRKRAAKAPASVPTESAPGESQEVPA